MVFEIRRVQMGEGKPFCLLCVYAPAVLEVNTTIQGLLQFSALIAAWDTHTQTNKRARRGRSPGRSCHFRDLNLILPSLGFY